MVRALRKWLCLYFYFVDREFGFLHIRLQSWFRFTIQVCLNGRDWLARKLDRHGIGQRKLDSAFLAIEPPAASRGSPTSLPAGTGPESSPPSPGA